MLESVPGWAWDVDAAAWREKLEALRAFTAAHGKLPRRHHPSGLGDWVHNQRQDKAAMDAGKGAVARRGMTPQRKAALEAVPGWACEPRDAAWGERLAELEAHVRARTALPTQGNASGLGKWISRQRQAKKAADAGRPGGDMMPSARVAALERVPGWTWDASRKRARDDESSGL